MSWVAYVDESMRQKLAGTGIYVLVATILDLANADSLREIVLSLRRGRRPFHWRFEEPADKRKAVSIVADLEALHLAVVGSRLDLRRQERARRQCLKRLLWSLDQAGVHQVWLDARTSELNARDLLFVDGMRDKGAIGRGIRVDFAQPFDGRNGEPLLWLPDIVAGAVSAAFGDGDDQYFQAAGAPHHGGDGLETAEPRSLYPPGRPRLHDFQPIRDGRR